MRFTCNQFIVLLDCYRGTFDKARHLGTVHEDMQFLVRNALVKADANITEEGRRYVTMALNMEYDEDIMKTITREQREVLDRRKSW